MLKTLTNAVKPGEAEPANQELSGASLHPRDYSTGLPSIQDIELRLKKLGGKLSLIDQKPDDFFGRHDVLVRANRSHKYPDTLHEQFKRDFALDRQEIALRLQRMKLLTLPSHVQGMHYAEKPENAAFDWGDHLPIAEFWSLAYGLTLKDAPVKEADTKALVDGFNMLVPEQFRIRWNPLLTHQDAQLLTALAGEMRWVKPQAHSDDMDRSTHLLRNIQDAEGRLFHLDCPLLFSMNEGGSPFEDTMSKVWSDYRVAMKQLAAIRESDTWFSPSYGESITPERGLHQESVPFASDYQRFKLRDTVDLERRLHKAVFRPTDYNERAHSFLFGGGLAALEGIFRLIESDLAYDSRRKMKAPDLPVLATEDIYFEVDHSIDSFCRSHGFDLKTIDPGDTKAIISGIKCNHPRAVFLNPMSNMFDMKTTDITAILTALSEWDWHSSTKGTYCSDNSHTLRHLYLVIDNSTLGKLATWKEFNFRLLPPFVRIASYESLIKFGEDGLDLVPAGLLTIIGEYADSEVVSIRQRMGFAPPENTVRKLEQVEGKDALDRKMARHSRNTKYLLQQLAPEVETKNSYFERLIHPSLPSHPQSKMTPKVMSDAGGLFNIEVQTEFLKDYRERHQRGFEDMPVPDHEIHKRAEEVAKAFTVLVTELAKLVDLEVRLGTSYGFNTTRVAVYLRQLPEELEQEFYYRPRPYIRVAPGTETIKDMVLFAAVMKRANEIFGKAIETRTILSLAEKLNRHELSVIAQ